MVKNILSGINEYRGALKLIRQLKLWKYFLIPILISILTALIIGFIAYGISDNIGVFLAKIWIWDWGKEVINTITTIVGAVFVIIVGLILYRHIIIALSSPFMSPVSEKIEQHLYKNVEHNHRITSFKEQLIRGIRISTRNLIKELLITLPVLLLKLIPGVNIVSTILLFLVQSYYAGFGTIDYTLERHLDYRNSIQFVSKNRGFAIGNGMIFMLFLLIPVIGIIIVFPLSVTAATTKTLVLLKNYNEK